MIGNLESHIKSTHDLSKISSIVCLEARGFFFAPILANRLRLPCVPIRKPGKLPGDVISTTYQKDYGPDSFELKTDAFEGIETGGKQVILVGDLLGMGGSIIAAKMLVETLGMEVAEAVFIFDVDVSAQFFLSRPSSLSIDLRISPHETHSPLVTPDS